MLKPAPSFIIHKEIARPLGKRKQAAKIIAKKIAEISLLLIKRESLRTNNVIVCCVRR